MAQRPEIKMKALKDFMSNGGGLLRKDAEYVLHSEQEALQHVQKGLGERLSPEAPKEETADEQTAATQTEPEDAPWTMQLEPDAYLAKYGPDGKHSAQAQAELNRRKASGDSKG